MESTSLLHSLIRFLNSYWQEIAALGIVILVVVIALWRRYRRTASKDCDQCQSGKGNRAGD